MLLLLVAQSFLTLCDPVDCSPPGSSVHSNLKARILEWVAIPFSRGSSQPSDGTWVSWQILHHLSHQGSPHTAYSTVEAVGEGRIGSLGLADTNYYI